MMKQMLYLMSSKQKKYSIGILFAILTGAMFETLGVSAIIPFIQAIMSPAELAKKWYITPIVDAFHIVDDYTIVVIVGLAIIMLYFVKNIYLMFSSLFQIRFRCGLQKSLATKMLSSYMKRPYTFFLNTNSSDLLRGINGDVYGVCTILDNLMRLLAEGLTTLLIGIFIIYTDPFMAMGVIVIAFSCVIGVTIIFRKKVRKMGELTRFADAQQYKFSYQAFNGSKEILVMNRSDMFVRAFENAYEEKRKAEVGNSFIAALPDRIIEAVCIGGIIGIVCIRVGARMDMTSFVPKLAAFAIAAFRILPSISKISGYLTSLIFQRPALLYVYSNIRDAEEYFVSLQKYSREHRKQNGFEDENIVFQKCLNIKSISWKYPNSANYVLKNTSLTIMKGEAVAFIGSSGTGKTTLADIILGLLPPESGSVEMDNIDVFAIHERWSKIIGYVPQSVFLTDDTIKNNISFGIDEKDIDVEKIWKAIDQAQMKDFVEQLPLGLDTIVGERGVKFSGGQRQRVAIARALYNNPDILVLDEATSALDNETEVAVMEAINALHGHKTMIIVAHRLSTIKNCDKIYEIKDGKVCLIDKATIFLEN